jgi:3-isopropylmalate dehydrogenase
MDAESDAIEAAVNKVLDDGLRTVDIMSEGMTKVSCSGMGEAVAKAVVEA